MTENDLKQLKDLPVPPPAEGAREAAVAAALAAFESAAVPHAGAPQGSAVPPRLRNTSSISEGSSKMRFRRPVAIAASIIVLALVVPFTLHLTLTPRVAHRVAPQDKLAALPRRLSLSHIQRTCLRRRRPPQPQPPMWTARAAQLRRVLRYPPALGLKRRAVPLGTSAFSSTQSRPRRRRMRRKRKRPRRLQGFQNRWHRTR